LPEFQSEFIKSQGQPINYKGKKLQMIDYFDVGKKGKIRITFLNTNSEWEQGIYLKTDKTLSYDNDKVKDIRFWEAYSPEFIDVEFETKNGLLEVWNVWDTGDGVVHAWHNGAAMIVEEIEHGKLYHCNDGHPDDNFDDLVFKIEILK
jgi:hypothetical protein